MDRITAVVMGRKVATAIEATPGATKTSVAEKAGIPWATFSRKINGHSEFTPSELLRVAQILGVMPSSFLPEQFMITAVAS